jgi:hypothetical protein
MSFRFSLLLNLFQKQNMKSIIERRMQYIKDRTEEYFDGIFQARVNKPEGKGMHALRREMFLGWSPH